MAQLQRPEIACMNGKLVQWDQVVLHAGSEAIIRGLNVLEGVEAFRRYLPAEVSVFMRLSCVSTTSESDFESAGLRFNSCRAHQ